MIKKLLILFSVIVVCTVSGCGSRSGSSGDERMTITVSILPLQYFIDRITGDDFQTQVLVPFGASPETYEPQPSQIRKAVNSAIYFNIGLMDSEIALSKALKSYGVPVVDLYTSVSLIEGEGVHSHHHHHEGQVHDHAHDHAGIDPHVWTSPVEVRKMAKVICDELSTLCPEAAVTYQENYLRFLTEIDSLDTAIRQILSEVTAPYFVIFHPAMGYYARDYGLEQIAIEEDGKEPSAAGIKRILQTIREHRIGTIFYQSQFDINSVSAIAAEAGIKAEEIDPLAYQWSENLFNITKSLKTAPNLK